MSSSPPTSAPLAETAEQAAPPAPPAPSNNNTPTQPEHPPTNDASAPSAALLDPNTSVEALIAAEVVPQSIPFRMPRTQRQGFVTGFDIHAEEEKAKRAARAKRFDLPSSPQEPQQQAGGAAEDDGGAVGMDVDEDEFRRREARAKRFGLSAVPVPMDVEEEPKTAAITDSVGVREDAVHMHGTDFMSTVDVLHFFEAYGPQRVEWINDSSCNVVFGDAFSAKRALIGLSEPISSEVERIEKTLERSKDAEVLAASREMLELIVWRRGAGDQLLLRLATQDDIKLPLSQRKPSKWYSLLARNAVNIRRNDWRVKKPSVSGSLSSRRVEEVAREREQRRLEAEQRKRDQLLDNPLPASRPDRRGYDRLDQALPSARAKTGRDRLDQPLGSSRTGGGGRRRRGRQGYRRADADEE